MCIHLVCAVSNCPGCKCLKIVLPPPDTHTHMHTHTHAHTHMHTSQRLTVSLAALDDSPVQEEFPADPIQQHVLVALPHYHRLQSVPRPTTLYEEGGRAG